MCLLAAISMYKSDFDDDVLLSVVQRPLGLDDRLLVSVVERPLAHLHHVPVLWRAGAATLNKRQYFGSLIEGITVSQIFLEDQV